MDGEIKGSFSERLTHWYIYRGMTTVSSLHLMTSLLPVALPIQPIENSSSLVNSLVTPCFLDIGQKSP